MKLQCPVPDCKYETEDLTNATLLSALLNLHATAHAKPATAAETAAALFLLLHLPKLHHDLGNWRGLQYH